MKNYKIYVSAILTLILIFGNITTCYCIESLEILEALGTVYSAVEASNSAESKRQAVSNWVHKNSEAAGFLFDATSSTLPSALWYLLPEPVQTELGENASDDDIVDACRTFILNNQTVSNNTVTDNSILKDGIINFVNEYTKNNQEYIYTIDIKEHPEVIPSTAIYFELAKKMNPLTHVNNMSIFCVRINGGVCQYAQIPYSDYPYAFCKSYTINNGWDGSAWSCGFIKDGYNNTNILGTRQNTDQKVSCMTWSNTEFVENSITWGGGYPFYGLKNPDNWVAPYGNDKYLLLSYGQTQAIRYLTTDATAQDILYQQYYYNDTAWNDFSTSSGDYTVNSSNVNTVSYGDTVSYIDSFNTENGFPPSPTEINVNIEREDTENKTPSGGDDNGGDNGGSGGSGSGDSSIFDWLKTLGAALGNLIKGIGEFLSEIVAGLVDAVTNLLQAISTLISGVLESLTNIFSGLIEFIYAGLPDDIRNILSLALVVAILITVLKLIRGN